MLLANSDKISKDNPIFILFLGLSIFGLYDITREILDDHQDFLSKNFVKKVILFSALYLKSESLYISSMLSVFIILIFPKVFFGEQTGPKSNC